ncbi:hypothetical protein J7370_06010 [Xanthomonas sp. D-93]|nr:hypothetical protein [Xanthomonas sp. D-93]
MVSGGTVALQVSQYLLNSGGRIAAGTSCSVPAAT